MLYIDFLSLQTPNCKTRLLALVFLSYRVELHSVIGYWHHHVAVCLSVCNAVHCGSQGRCTGLKVVLYHHVPSKQVPICPFRHFCGSQGRCTGLKVVLYHHVPSKQVPICPFRHFCCTVLFSHKTHRQNEWQKTRMWVFWNGQPGIDWSCYVVYLSFTDFANQWTLVCHAECTGHTWIDRVWVRSWTIPVESDHAYQPFVNL